MKRIKRLPSSVNAPDFVPTVDEDLTMIWRELENLKRSIKPSGTTTINNVTNVTGGRRFVATDITISDAQETSISHGLGTVPTTIIVVPRHTDKRVHRQWINEISGTIPVLVTVNHNLNSWPTSTPGTEIEVLWSPIDTGGGQHYYPIVQEVVSANTVKVRFRTVGTATLIVGWLTLRRGDPTWWTTRPSDSTNVYLRASKQFLATVIVEE